MRSPRPCDTCGMKYSPVSEDSRFCSGTCSARHAADEARVRRTREKLDARLSPKAKVQGHLFRGRLS